MKTELAVVVEIFKKYLRKKPFFNDNLQQTIVSLVYYFNGNPEFEKGGFSLHKGLLLAGDPGCGKTILTMVFRDYCKYLRLPKRFGIAYVNDVADEYAINGISGIQLYMNNARINSYGVKAKHPIGLCFDDLGTEPQTVLHYGTKENVIARILIKRYDLFRLGVMTHGTTNLSPTMLAERYGERIYSRFQKMFNYIHIEGPDYRQL